MNTNKDIAGQNQKTDEIISQRRNAFTNAINANVNKSILFGLKEEDIATFLSPRKMCEGGGYEAELAKLRAGETELKTRFNQDMQALQEASINKFETQKLAWDKSDELGKGVVGVNPLQDPLKKEPEKQETELYEAELAKSRAREAELKTRFNQEMQALQEASFNKFKTQKLVWDKSDELGKGVVQDPPEKQKGWSNLLRAFSGIGLDALANIGERVTNESDLNAKNKLYNQTVAENLFNTVSASKGYNTINPTISGVASPNLTGFTNQFQGYAALGGDKQSTSFQKGTKLDYDENTLKELDKLGIKYKIVTE